jgi:uncharacterized membrane protein
MGQYGGELPITGVGAITFAGLSLNSLWLAVLATALIVGGAFVMRVARPVRVRAGVGTGEQPLVPRPSIRGARRRRR